MDDADAGGEGLFGAVKVDPVAEDDHTAFIRPVNARQDLPQRALARAVLAAEGMTRPCGDREAHVLERERAWKSLGDPLEGDRGGRSRRHARAILGACPSNHERAKAIL
jgi:hypothetical protein